ncbi:protein of unknown function [Georgfuchsia toluolica]|uniref:Extradiol ring-cleavage dioxygenase LigAB LigA subunit domain-containing protein n=1 Tax=Georgfuchsia toluolica TaxID=424218 RepID=A0A916N914_9PROT|nr:hypothetical protein [Georgfuchsia toluolica]CAG4883285.1 protein of unknown function [Georgfuchsia toluolica]
MNSGKQKRVIPGTTMFDGEQACKGYALNKMSFPFNSVENRTELLLDKKAYCSKYGLNTQQRARRGDWHRRPLAPARRPGAPAPSTRNST